MDRRISVSAATFHFFSVPTGNFGDIYAGHVARGMGLPISTLMIATNQNDILARTLETGVYAASAKVQPQPHWQSWGKRIREVTG